MQPPDADTACSAFAFADARDLHGPHAGQPLSAESLQMLRRLAVCAQRLQLLDLPQEPLARLTPNGGDMIRPAASAPAVADDPVDRMNVCLDRIAQFDPELRAMSFVDETGGRTAALLARSSTAGPLAGLPIVVKDNTDVAGMPTGYGAAACFQTVPTRDADVVSALRRAGAIVLGKSNMFEFAYGAAHPSVGDTRNPLDLARSAGGSSGGSAAAIAAGFAFGAIGTDTGGSIRLPAAYCGIVGMKPSHGRVPMRGVFPLSPTLDHAGPMAAGVGDVRLMLAAMTGPLPSSRSQSPLCLAVLDDWLYHPLISPDVRNCIEAACDHLAHAGFRIRHIPKGTLPDPMLVVETLLLVMAPEAAIALERIEAAHPQSLTPATRAQIAEGFAIPAVWTLRAHQFRGHLRAALAEALQGDDALLLPTAPTLPPTGAAEVGSQDDLSQMLCLAPFNLTGQPAITLPVRVPNSVIPAGLQLVRSIGDDAALLDVAERVEAALVCY